VKVHIADYPVGNYNDTWVSVCGIFEPKLGTDATNDVTCERCLRMLQKKPAVKQGKSRRG